MSKRQTSNLRNGSTRTTAQSTRPVVGDQRGDPKASTKRRATRLLGKLKKLYPDAHCALDHKNPFELLIATILSAQCTDVRVNMVTPDLFKKYPTPNALCKAKLSDIEELIRTTGFFRNKSKSIQGASQRIVQRHDGQVPKTMGELLELPGVARKTANVVLGNAFGINAGVVVDTHVARLSRRLGLTEQKDPVKIERDLMALFPQPDWTLLSHLLIFHGRQVCSARRPQCIQCPLAKDCPMVGVDD